MLDGFGKALHWHQNSPYDEKIDFKKQVGTVFQKRLYMENFEFIRKSFKEKLTTLFRNCFSFFVFAGIFIFGLQDHSLLNSA